MTDNTAPTALIAEDEPLLAAVLRKELAALWPELRILETVGDGIKAAEQAVRLQPDVLFFDIAMPGMNGIDAAADVFEDWPADAAARPFPLLVFVTAYDEYACRAFEAEAVDYVLKPVQGERLQRTVAKLKKLLAQRAAPQAGAFDATLEQLRHLLAATAAQGGKIEPLKVIQAGVTTAQGNLIKLVAVDDVLYFEAADKYVRVVTMDAEYLIRTALKDLLPQLASDVFWRIHRGTAVRIAAVETVHRNDMGRLHLSLLGRPEKLPVGRIYSHLFRAM